jgi:hypothetical protein
MSRRALSGAIVALACLVSTPALAGANPLDVVSAAPPRFRPLLREELHTGGGRGSFATESRLTLKSQHGYRLAVIGEGNVVALVVMRDRRYRTGSGDAVARSRAVTVYVTRGRATRSRIEGSFGSLGSIAVRFRPSGRMATGDRRRCLGRRRFVYRRGSFVGRIRFTGEHRYVAVHAHRVKGRMRTPLHLHCRGADARLPLRQRGLRSTARRRRPSFAVLSAEHREATTGTELLALQAGRVALLVATAEESLGETAEVRYGLVVAPGTSLRHDDSLTSATLAPPRPFHGKGVYRAAPDGTTTWAGSLAIAFPGTPRLPLAGSGFAAELEAGL